MPGIFWLVPVISLVTVLFIVYLARFVLAKDTGTPKMREVGDMIFEGAWAFLNRQYRTIGILSIFVAVAVGAIVGLLSGENTPGDVGQAGIMWRTGVAFLVGAICSGISGFAGMYIAVKSNVRCAAAAQRSWREAIDVAMRGGAVSGFLITTLSLIGVTAIFFAFGGNSEPEIAPHLIVGFGFGASFVALFAQLGGGIYTKAADMGADLVGKVEAGIPEDDSRNAAVIADLVGDNVGDCAGRGADLFESTAAENIGAMILGASVYAITGDVAWIIFPLVVRAFGLVASMIGLLIVKAKEEEDPMAALNRGYWMSIVLSAIGMVITVTIMLDNFWLAAAGLVGILASVAILYITQYYTDTKYKPVKDLAQASRTGSATNIVGGIAIGFETALPTALVIGISLLVAYFFGQQSGVEGAGAFGTAVATMGMLMTCPYVLAMDTFGPITDNANGINEMAGAGPQVRKITDRLDAVGNTTKALTKGYALVSAGLAAFLLFQAYMDQVEFLRGTPFDVIDLAKPEVFVGGLFAVMLVFLFSSWAIKAVGNTAQLIIEEVRRQFRENPKIMTWEAKPDYARAVDITARAGLREMIKPGLLPVLAPLVLGVGFNLIEGYDAAMAVGAMLMVGTIGGIMLAAFMNNSGGAWDNAKKYIEDGQLKDDKGVVQGKRTFAHAAAVVGDTVGDPLKDTAGPSLHVLIKLLSTITLVLVPLFI
ncbi:sodium-translocating pyrophosphatase [Dehalogenimonas alkenigignens]|uniref:K(+)-insensitive pyrophosphate-energized proton pump n=1 Tax=Dehalogenimonas alkenigignens TaxID=1217799 RepID=A0A0W0GKJ4_9CHLR|nr:sodium-translocating pyrophosphatase [Dehalogenimonas alkenigignens]KTB49059.1 vacuolar-type H(+)-translocating pyrophosphatase [Dehalogenimonas alkenigignens]PVV83166.1 sodium-translocating pyrophosphatase [Dehalogenimonas alkenigignens]